MELYKKVNKNGSITIPQLLRHELGIVSGIPLKLEAVEEGLLLSKYVPTCCVCGSTVAVGELSGISACATCVGELLRRCGTNGSNND